MPIECVCCDARIERKNQRRFRGVAMRLFVSARRNMALPISGSICNTCRMCYRDRHNNVEFINILYRLEDESNEMNVGSGNDVRFSNRIYMIISLIISF